MEFRQGVIERVQKSHADYIAHQQNPQGPMPTGMQVQHEQPPKSIKDFNDVMTHQQQPETGLGRVYSDAEVPHISPNPEVLPTPHMQGRSRKFREHVPLRRMKSSPGKLQEQRIRAQQT
jgi:hypothetical protein